MVEYRIVWRRVDGRLKRKRYATRRAVDRFLLLLSPEPWKAFGKDPDAFACCRGFKRGAECGCDGATYREQSDAIREGMPDLEFVRVETRTVGEWS